MSEKVVHTCARCGFVRILDSGGVHDFALRDPLFSRYCKDCRGSEKSRLRDNFVPAEAIAEAVRQLKEKQVA